MIRYHKHHQINKTKWDECIRNSVNGIVYAYSWYLDLVSPGWAALIENDYKSVMPLTVRKKFFLPVLIQPPFTQKLGVFSDKLITSQKIKEFLASIPAKFIWQKYNLNSFNFCTHPHLNVRRNYELNLGDGYPCLSGAFHENTRRNIRKAGKAGITIERSDQAESFLTLFFSNYKKSKINKYVSACLKKITEYSVAHSSGEILMARNAAGEVIAGAFFLNDSGRIVYLVSFSTDEGYRNSAMHLLLSKKIEAHAADPVVFDFEGSRIPGIASFFTRFGAKEVWYPVWHKSTFDPILSLFGKNSGKDVL